MTSWYVGWTTADWPFECQLNSPTEDGQPDENARDNCGETSVSMVGRRYTGQTIEPDTIKDFLLGQAKTGVSYDNQLRAALSHFFTLPSVTVVPTQENGDGGLLRYEWQYLYGKQPIIGAFDWVDAGGTAYPNITHWRVVYGMDSASVYSADPWTGQPMIEAYATHFARCKLVLVAVTQKPPA